MENRSNYSARTDSVSLLSEAEKAGWAVVFGLIGCAIIVSNAFTLAVFLGSKLKERRSTFLLINLTVTDGLVGMLSTPLFIYLLVNEGRYGIVLYNVYTFQDIVLGITSVSTLATIALERFYGVWYPFVYRGTLSRAHFFMISLSWICGIVIATVRVLTSFGLVHMKTFTYCMVIAIAFPLIMTCILYFAVWMATISYSTHGKTSDKETNLSTTLFIITIIFVISWTPFPIANVVNAFSQGLDTSSSFMRFTFAAKLLQYGNSFTDPIIYTLRISEFRTNLVRMICKGTCVSRFDDSRINSSFTKKGQQLRRGGRLK